MTAQIITLDLYYHFFGIDEVIHPVILKGGAATVLVDCGGLGHLPRLEEAVSRTGLCCEDLTHIVVTHHDHDHIGTLAAFRRQYPAVKIVAGRAEAPYIAGELPALRLVQAEARQHELPEDHKAFGEAFINIVKSIEHTPVDITVEDGDTFDWCGGCRVISTPGHTKGHISLWLEAARTVITGDAAVAEGGRLAVANPAYAWDLALAEQSLLKLTMLHAAEYICYHGGVWHSSGD